MQRDVMEWSGALDELGLELAQEILASWRREGWQLVGAVINGRQAEEQWWIFSRSEDREEVGASRPAAPSVETAELDV